MSACLKLFIKPEMSDIIAVPAYQTAGAACLDLQAAIKHTMIVSPGERNLIATGVFLEIPEGYEGQVRPRSGMAMKYGVTVLNSPGTIDSDYRGEVSVILHNSGGLPFTVRPGDRIAQLVIAPVSRLPIEVVTDKAMLTSTSRGAGGFGSTGS